MCAFFNLKDNTLHIMETPVLEQTLNKCLSLPSETSPYSDTQKHFPRHAKTSDYPGFSLGCCCKALCDVISSCNRVNLRLW